MKPMPQNLNKCLFLCWLAILPDNHAALALDRNEWEYSQEVAIPQSGPIRVDLPAATLGAARSDLADLRILDPSGNEVSYVIERPMPEPESTIRPAEFKDAINPDSTSTITMRVGSSLPVNALELETPARRFIKSVTVESSADGFQWQQVENGRPIFRLPAGAENLRIDLPHGAYNWMRLTINDSREEPVPFSSATFISPGSNEAPSAALPVKIKSRDESPGVTRLSIDLGAPNMPVSTLKIDAADPLFTREVSMAEPVMQNSVMSEQPVGDGIIYRVNLDGTNRERLDIPVDRQIETRDLVLLIHNKDSAPLTVNGVEATRREVWIIYYAPVAGKYTLLTGNGNCPPASYDVTGLALQSRKVGSTVIEPGPLAENSGYHPPEALGSLTLQGAAIDLADWKYHKLLAVAKPGAQQVELDPDVLANARSDLADIRIVQGGQQIPFVLEQTSIVRTVPLSVSEKNDSDNPTHSIWVLTLSPAGLPIDAVTCESPTPLFERSMRLWEEAEDTGTRELGATAWSRVPGDQQTARLVLPFETRPEGGTLNLETDNGDNAPLKLNSFEGEYSATRVIFKAPADSLQPVWLCYGNPDAGSPNYDLRLIADELLRSDRQPITAGSQAIGNELGTTATVALTGASRYLFWGALVLVVIALLAVTAKLLPKEQNDPPQAGA